MTTPATVRAWESHFTLYRTIWKSNMLGAFVQPFLYLVGMGLGVVPWSTAATTPSSCSTG